MKNVIFSEKKDIEKVLASGEVTQDNVVRVISSMAKYNLSIHNLSDEDNYVCITNWLKAHYQYYVETYKRQKQYYSNAVSINLKHQHLK